jgi:threonine dehydratase
MLTPAISLDEIRRARARIAPHIRRTPTIQWSPAVTLKLEYLQIGGSFKARGAFNKILAAEASTGAPARGPVVTASGGNHGLGVAYAAHSRGLPSVVYLPESAPVSTERRLLALGTTVIRHGKSWDDAWQRALGHPGLLVHPFEDRDVIAGQGTVGLELAEQLPEVDLVLVAVGGGGLISGVALALRALRPSVRVVGVEPTGATSMKDSLAAGRVVTLDSIQTIAGTLAPRAIGENTLAICREHVSEVVLVDDDELRATMRRLWSELRILVEPAGAAAVAALLSGRVALEGARSIAVLVCGANLDPELATAALG